MSYEFKFSPFRSFDDFLLSKARFQKPRFNQRITSNLLYYQTNYFFITILSLLLFGKRAPLTSILTSLGLISIHASMRTRNLKNKITNTMDIITDTKTPMGVILDTIRASSDEF